MDNYEKELMLFKKFNNNKRRECYHTNSFLDKTDSSIETTRKNTIEVAKQMRRESK